LIGPVFDYTVDARGSANGAALPISVEEGDAKLGDSTTHGIVYARVEEGIGPFETGNATASIVGMNFADGTRDAGKSRKEHETCHEKKILSELAHF
jgi:hypothetical protein